MEYNRATWDPQPLLDMLTKYDVTSEMLLYRFSELIPQFAESNCTSFAFSTVKGTINW